MCVLAGREEEKEEGQPAGDASSAGQQGERPGEGEGCSGLSSSPCWGRWETRGGTATALLFCWVRGYRAGRKGGSCQGLAWVFLFFFFLISSFNNRSRNRQRLHERNDQQALIITVSAGGRETHLTDLATGWGKQALTGERGSLGGREGEEGLRKEQAALGKQLCPALPEPGLHKHPQSSSASRSLPGGNWEATEVLDLQPKRNHKDSRLLCHQTEPRCHQPHPQPPRAPASRVGAWVHLPFPFQNFANFYVNYKPCGQKWD